MLNITLFVMAVLQGITEFLPVSSSLHLLTAARIINVHQSLDLISSISVFLNLGTLLALICYYWADIYKLILGAIDFICFRKTKNRDLFLNISAASIPTLVIFGYVELCLGGPNFSVNTTILAIVIFSLVLYFCDRYSNIRNVTRPPALKEWFIVGIAQAFSIIPGASRLGVTLSAFRLLSFNRTDSFKYSMLLSLPPVMCANIVKGAKLVISDGLSLPIELLLSGIGIAFIFGLITLRLVNWYISRYTFGAFALYRLIFAAGCLYWGLL